MWVSRLCPNRRSAAVFFIYNLKIMAMATVPQVRLNATNWLLLIKKARLSDFKIVMNMIMENFLFFNLYIITKQLLVCCSESGFFDSKPWYFFPDNCYYLTEIPSMESNKSRIVDQNQNTFKFSFRNMF